MEEERELQAGLGESTPGGNLDLKRSYLLWMHPSSSIPLRSRTMLPVFSEAHTVHCDVGIGRVWLTRRPS